MKTVILIKFGGSIITDKNVPYKARPDVIQRLAKEIKESASLPIVIANGNGSFGHTSSLQYGGKKGYKSKEGIAKVCKDVIDLNSIVIDLLIKEGLAAVSLHPMSMILTNEGKIKKYFFDAIEEVIRQNLIPVLHGDVIWDKKWKSTIYSGETILNEIGLYLEKHRFKIGKIIQVGQTDGVYDSKGNTIPVISKDSWEEVKRYLFDNKAADISGGIKHKIESSLYIADKGIETLILNGLVPNELSNALLGKPVNGTIIN